MSGRQISNLFSRASIGHSLQSLYGRVAPNIPAGLRLRIQAYILPLIKKMMHKLFRDRGRVLPLAAPLEGHQMLLPWPDKKSYVLGTHEPGVCKIIQKYVKPGYIAFDIGAHIGYFTLLLAKQVGDQGLVVAFEPLEENFEALQENVKMNHYDNVLLENKAVSEATGVAILYRDEWDIFPAASHLSESTRSRLFAYQVSTVSLDEYVNAKGIRPVHFVKIDVEGAEERVIQGMQGILLRDKPILVIEIHEEANGSPSRALAILRQVGYKLWKIDCNGIAGNASLEYRGHVLAVPNNEPNFP